MAKNFEITGTLRKIFDTQTFNSGFTKREFVIEVADGNYPQMIKFELIKDRVNLIDGHSEGDELLVKFDIRGNEYNERFYVNLNAWRIERASGEGGLDSGPARQQNDFGSAANVSDDDDIPF